jgi:hypothetical protein
LTTCFGEHKIDAMCAYPYFVVSSEAMPFRFTPGSLLYRDLTNSRVPESETVRFATARTPVPYHVQCTFLSHARVLPLAGRSKMNHKREQPLALRHPCMGYCTEPCGLPILSQTSHKRHHVVCLARPVSNRLCERDWSSPIYVN